jgi:hypothetical protein
MPDKERERFYLEMLRRAMPEIPSVGPTEPEPPDFLFATAEGTLGIEFTAFHLPPAPGDRPHQERQALKERIVTLAEQLHEQRGGPSLYVDVQFNDHLALDNKDAVRLAGQIADSVLGSPIPTSISEPVQVPWRTRPKEISGIRVHPTVDPEDRLWAADAGGWVATITSDHLNRVLQAKGKTISLARPHCDKLWLVIVNDTLSRAAPVRASAETLAQVYSTSFDRVIWFLPHEPQAIDLQVCPPAA